MYLDWASSVLPHLPPKKNKRNYYLNNIADSDHVITSGIEITVSKITTENTL